jgi:hypothetical protein
MHELQTLPTDVFSIWHKHLYNNATVPFRAYASQHLRAAAALRDLD